MIALWLAVALLATASKASRLGLDRSKALLRERVLLRDDLGLLQVVRSREAVAEAELEVHARWHGLRFLSGQSYVGVYPCFEEEEECEVLGKFPIQFRNVGKLSYGETNFTILIRPGFPAFRLAFVTAATSPFPEIAAISEILVVSDAALRMPRQLRLSLVTEDSSAIRFAFSSYKNTPSDFVLAISDDDEGVINQFEPSNRTLSYSRVDMCDKNMMPAASTGFVPPGFQNEVIVSNLKQGKTYDYTLRHRDTVGEEQVVKGSFVFRPSARIRESNFVIFGDMGQTMEEFDGSLQHSWDYEAHGEIDSFRVVNMIEKLMKTTEIDAIVHIGDISYATGALALWDTFLYQVESLSKQVPYMVGIGNHELGFSKSFIPGSDSQGECGVPYSTFFPFAGQKSAKEEPWYSIEVGEAHITIISTEHDISEGSVQMKWLKDDLASVNRSETPWLIVMGHRPIYVSSSWAGDSIQASCFQKWLDPVFDRFGVDIYFAGHHHSYQRSCRRLIHGKCQATSKGVQHVIVGTGGYAFSSVAHSDQRFEVVNNNTHGALLLKIAGKSAHIKFLSADGKMIDQKILLQDTSLSQA